MIWWICSGTQLGMVRIINVRTEMSQTCVIQHHQEPSPHVSSESFSSGAFNKSQALYLGMAPGFSIIYWTFSTAHTAITLNLAVAAKIHYLSLKPVSLTDVSDIYSACHPCNLGAFSTRSSPSLPKCIQSLHLLNPPWWVFSIIPFLPTIPIIF